MTVSCPIVWMWRRFAPSYRMSDGASRRRRCHVSSHESDGASRRHVQSSCRVSDGASRRRSDVGCRVKFVADPVGVIFYSDKYLLWNISCACFTLVTSPIKIHFTAMFPVLMMRSSTRREMILLIHMLSGFSIWSQTKPKISRLRRRSWGGGGGGKCISIFFITCPITMI